MTAIAIPILALLADAPSPDQHRLRIHADVQPARVSISGERGQRTLHGGFGVLGPSSSLGFGFAPHPIVLVGARVRGGLQVFDSRYGSSRNGSKSGSIGFLPYLEVRPMPRRRVQPFALIEPGVDYEASAFDSTEYGHHSTEFIVPSLGGRVGLHAFVLPQLSIDADIGAAHRWSFWIHEDASNDAAKSWLVSATIGVSGWF